MPVNYLYWIFLCTLASYIPHTKWRFSNAHNFVKNLVWTSFYSPFWSSWADLSFAPTFRVWRQILIFLLALSIKATVPRYSCWVTTWCMRCYFDLLRQPCQNVQEGNDLCYICMPNGTFWILVKIQPIKDTVHFVKIESEFLLKINVSDSNQLILFLHHNLAPWITSPVSEVVAARWFYR